jgi:DNA-binding protein H-NS
MHEVLWKRRITGLIAMVVVRMLNGFVGWRSTESISDFFVAKEKTMATYIELKAQAEAILAQAESVRKQELAAVVQDIKAKMREHGLTVADLGGSTSGGARKASAKSKSTAPAKYRGPNGELWAGGLGRKPEWVRAVLAAGKNIDHYLI